MADTSGTQLTNSGQYIATPELTQRISTTLASKYPSVHTTADYKEFDQSLHRTTKALFNKSFGYSWEGANTVAPGKPSKAVLRPINDFTHVEVGNVTKAAGPFLDILKQSKAPKWATDKAILDIGTRATAIFNDATNSEWKETTFRVSYEDPNGKDGLAEIHATGIYTSAAVTENRKTSNHLILYYLAVYYGPLF